ncbi:Complement C5 [Bagarius yarrelli]|uniref:Complement C5 n=1 Tax=Bagarius yarrelli TaxID=175774 RepID=A0A556V3G5_BAGYA|nr:Complement C5 [Bagarius yarrelli]
MMDLFFLLCVIHVLSVTEAQQRTYLITAPKVLRVDASETVLVHLYGYDQETIVNLYLKDNLAHEGRIYASSTLKLNDRNNYQAETTLRVFPNIEQKVTHLHLQAVSSSFTNVKKIPVIHANGFLFIQTDKPLYTPEQQVEVRVYSLNEELRKTSRPVLLTFKDPDGIKVEIIEMNDIFNGVKPLLPPFKIPLKPKFGIWKIEAAYAINFTTTAVAEFEVKEYVLPSISLRIQPEANYVSIANYEAFKLKIFAKYISGKAVRSADVFTRFGYINNHDVVMIPQTLSQYKMDDGEMEVVLNIKHDLFSVNSGPQQLWDMNNHFLRVVVLLKESTGGLSQEAVLSNVKFVHAPFTLSLIATPPFIKPALPYQIRVLVKDPLGEIASGVPVKARVTITYNNNEQEELHGYRNEMRQTSRNDGVAYFVCNIPDNVARAELFFETADPKYPPESQTQLKLSTLAYKSVNQRYLYISLPAHASAFEVDDHASININFHYRDFLPLKTFSYQILSKGKVVRFATEQRISHSVQSINFKVTSNMVPSARLVVYYILFGEQTAELVADSVWFDVKAKCVNNLDVNLSAPSKSYKPKDRLMLSVKSRSANEKFLVTLSAVDTALYNLRGSNKDPLNKVLQRFEHSDLGCGGGGGRNNADVFSRAGLTILTNANVEASDAEFQANSVRRKRADLSLNEKLEAKAKKYRNFHQCCIAGTDSSPILETCRERTQKLKTEHVQCKIAFRDCCFYAEKLRAESGSVSLARSEIEFLLEVKSEQIRSYFPESWLWEEHENERSGLLQVTRGLPHSLTIWEIRAVGVFNNGICMADPLQVSVQQAVSVDVPLPYSIVRGEQIELKGSVYNEYDTVTTYSVTLSASEGVCVFRGTLLTEDGDQQSNKGTIKGHSVALVQFFIMALEVGNHNLSFTLTTKWGCETVVKTLRVVPEGIRKEIYVGRRIDPSGIYGTIVTRIELRNSLPPKIVPKSTVERLLTVNGEVLGELLSIIINPKGIMQLTNLPRGSGEAELVGLLPIFYVYDYIEQSEQWGKISKFGNTILLKRKLKQGITSVMSFKSKWEDSFSLWKNKEPSTWLTALVVKTLASVNKYVTVDHNQLSSTVYWLITKCQTADGAFKEISSYKPMRLMGAGGDVNEQSVFLTSFVVIAIKNALTVPKSNLEMYHHAVEKATHYLTLHLTKVSSLYVKAIAAYALTVVDFNNHHAVTLYENLKKKAKIKGNPVTVRFWEENEAPQDPLKPNRATAQSVETTVYMLLNTLFRGDTAYSKPIIQWLTDDQRYGGGFHSTQDSILTLEALTKYSNLVRRANLQMEVDVSYRKKGSIDRVTLTQDKPVGKPIELRTIYYETSDDNNNCNFDITVDVHPRDPNSQDPITLSPRIVACARYKPQKNEVENEAGHTVMEINLPTGMSPIQEDLKRFRDGLESRISDYEIIDNQVVLQIDSIPSEEFYCVGFRIQEVFRTGMNSASVFKVYEYHDPDSQCTKFYYSQSHKLLRLCDGDQCQCMAAECCNFRANIDPTLTVEKKLHDVCKANIKYALKVKITAVDTEGDFLTYRANVEAVIEKGLLDITRSGTSEVSFVKKATCTSANLEVGKQYLITGTEVMQLRINRSYKYKFPLDLQASVDWWPSECQTSACQQYTEVLNNFEFDYLNSSPDLVDIAYSQAAMEYQAQAFQAFQVQLAALQAKKKSSSSFTSSCPSLLLAEEVANCLQLGRRDVSDFRHNTNCFRRGS